MTVNSRTTDLPRVGYCSLCADILHINRGLSAIVGFRLPQWSCLHMAAKAHSYSESSCSNSFSIATAQGTTMYWSRQMLPPSNDGNDLFAKTASGGRWNKVAMERHRSRAYRHRYATLSGNSWTFAVKSELREFSSVILTSICLLTKPDTANEAKAQKIRSGILKVVQIYDGCRHRYLEL